MKDKDLDYFYFNQMCFGVMVINVSVDCWDLQWGGGIKSGYDWKLKM